MCTIINIYTFCAIQHHNTSPLRFSQLAFTQTIFLSLWDQYTCPFQMVSSNIPCFCTAYLLFLHYSCEPNAATFNKLMMSVRTLTCFGLAGDCLAMTQSAAFSLSRSTNFLSTSSTCTQCSQHSHTRVRSHTSWSAHLWYRLNTFSSQQSLSLISSLHSTVI